MSRRWAGKIRKVILKDPEPRDQEKRPKPQSIVARGEQKPCRSRTGRGGDGAGETDKGQLLRNPETTHRHSDNSNREPEKDSGQREGTARSASENSHAGCGVRGPN